MQTITIPLSPAPPLLAEVRRVQLAHGLGYQIPGHPEYKRRDGPGTQLHSLLAVLGITPQSGCGCEGLAGEMDRGGVGWCKDNRDRIIAHLKEQADQRSWLEWARAGVRFVASGLAFKLDPLDPFGSLVDEAIRRAGESIPG